MLNVIVRTCKTFSSQDLKLFVVKPILYHSVRTDDDINIKYEDKYICEDIFGRRRREGGRRRHIRGGGLVAAGLDKYF